MIMVCVLGFLGGLSWRLVFDQRRKRLRDSSALKVGETVVEQALLVHTHKQFVGEETSMSRTVEFTLRGVGKFQVEVSKVSQSEQREDS
ncbi:hypothetical protein [Sphingomonas oligophenolica]|uniref:Uncharacterized protein n=1 Tax=Sphingomonas oligophenolica TaxID=301154 RepID=A0A502C473_9SPHN|nr:hypothetical protein [Sphingomonas oligophenolica]TPG06546.1 hypothetical protein EAH84_14795 [Sphingomonas oligophenolica]